MSRLSTRDAPFPLPTSDAVLASVFVIAGMAILSTILTGPSSDEWEAYATLYGDRGGWLLHHGRDPAFIWLIARANAMFGPSGYPSFRAWLSVAFSLFGVWLVQIMPLQTKIPQLSAAVSALIVLTALALKGFVQIREGLAFVLLVIPLAGMFVQFRRMALASGIAASVAVSFHVGVIVFAAAWLATVGLCLLPDRLLASTALQRLAVVISLILASGLGWYFVQHEHAVRMTLSDFGVDETARVSTGLWKNIYWVANGAIGFQIRREVLLAVRSTPRFSYIYATTLASVVLPLTYSLCVFLVASGFPTPALTAMTIRLFYTSAELGLIIIALRGRLTFVTVAAALFMLADRLRLVVG